MSIATMFSLACPLLTRNTLHIYSDGYVACVRCDAVRRGAIDKAIRRDYPDADFAVGEPSGIAYWVVRTDTSAVPMEMAGFIEAMPPVLAVVTTHYHDHRDEDANTLQSAAALVSGAMERAE